MGRPLFSQLYHSKPVIQTEQSSYEKWTVWNRFDPDSDEFFENEHAVYEAFIDPATQPPPSPEQEQEPHQYPSNGEPTSPSSSEGSVSEQGSPMAVGSDDDPASMLAEAYPDLEERFILNQPQVQLPPTPPQNNNNASFYQYIGITDALERRNVNSSSAPRGIHRPRSATISVLPHAAPGGTHVAESVPRVITVTDPPFTPPRRYIAQYTPSPAPNVTPRIYTWNAPPSPTPNNRPLPNHNARMSVSHIQASLVPVGGARN